MRIGRWFMRYWSSVGANPASSGIERKGGRMTYSQAIEKAQKRAQRLKQWIYVVWDGDGYETASDWDMETWFLGSDPVATVNPCGEVEPS